MLDKHRTFVERHVDPKVLSAAEPDAVMTFASQVLSPWSDISASGEVEVANKVFTDERRAVLARKKAIAWESQPRLDAIQVLPGHLFHFL